MRRRAPIFAVHDLDAAMAYYQRLGFAFRAYPGGGYGFAFHNGIEIYLGVVPGNDRRTSSACLFGDDADGPAAARRSAGAEFTHRRPPYGVGTKTPLSTPTKMHAADG